LAAYEVLKHRVVGYPPNHDPCNLLLMEADIVQAVVTDYIPAANIGLQKLADSPSDRLGISKFQVFCLSDSTHGLKVMRESQEVTEMSQVDKAWAFVNPHTQTLVKFAILEFKRTGSLKPTDWFNLSNIVSGDGNKICRQLKKYCHGYGITRAGCCTYKKLVHLLGDPSLHTTNCSTSKVD
jgi:hypothetical protein